MGEWAVYWSWNFSYFLRKRSIRPAESISFCLPVKKGWHFEQISTRISDFVDPTSSSFPQAHFMVVVAYSGWIFAFMYCFKPPLFYVFIESKNALLSFVPFILSSKNSKLSTGFNDDSNFLKIHTRFNISWDKRSSSFRVPDFLISIAGNTRLSASLRSSWISIFPVPLNSSKITSSMRLPVSTRAVAIMVRLPPSSIFLAAPKNRFGRWSAFESTPPERIFPLGGYCPAGWRHPFCARPGV